MFYFILILIIGLAVYSFLEPYLLRVETVELDRGKDLQGLKIVHLTDFHSRRFEKKEKKVLTKLRKINPDYVFVTGDFVDFLTRDLDSCQKFWEALTEQYRVFGVTGNHEYKHGKTEQIISRLERSGIRLLNNESVQLSFHGKKFVLAGVKDPHLGHADLKQALPQEGAEILLAHSPEIFKEAKDEQIDLVLSGHTHGGQVNIPLLTPLILPLRYGKKYKQGWFEEQDTVMHVSRGIGTTILPIRFNAPPEITLIKFK